MSCVVTVAASVTVSVPSPRDTAWVELSYADIRGTGHALARLSFWFEARTLRSLGELVLRV